MKRRLTKLVVFLLLGAIVNVAVAWWCALPYWPWRDSETITHSRDMAREACVRYFPVASEIPAELFDGQDEITFGRRFVIDFSQSHGPDEFYVEIFLAGWPSYSMHGVACASNNGLDLRSIWVLPWEPGHLLSPALPLRPVWPGFAINTIVYAVIVRLFWVGAFGLRRFIRHKRGHCIKCGYDLRGHTGENSGGGGEVCPECGQ